MNKLTGTSLSGSGKNRVENDFYATNPKSVEDLFKNHEINGYSVWEPAAGQGHISNVLKNHFPEVYSSDLIDRGCGFYEVDFLSYNGDKKVDWVITNPPFKYSREFIEKGLEVSNKGVAMFLKVQFLEGIGRKQFLKDSPLKYVYVFSKRQVIFRNGQELNEKGKPWANTMCFCWFVWEKDYTGESIIRWI